MANDLVTPDSITVGRRVRVENPDGHWDATVISKSKKALTLVDDNSKQRQVFYCDKESRTQRDGQLGWYDPALGNTPQGHVRVTPLAEGLRTFPLLVAHARP